MNPYNLHNFLADLQRGQSDQLKREHDLAVIRALTESVAKPVPSVGEQGRVVERMGGGA